MLLLLAGAIAAASPRAAMVGNFAVLHARETALEPGGAGPERIAAAAATIHFPGGLGDVYSGPARVNPAGSVMAGTASAAPEPDSWMLLAIGVGLLALRRSRSRPR